MLRSVPPAPPAASTPANVLSSDVEIKGTVTFEGSLFTDGRIDGDILSSGTLIIGEHGSVRGDITASIATVHGKIEGNVSVEDRCELKGDAQLIGDLEAPRLVMEEGATFIGSSKVGPRSGEVAPEGKNGERASASPKPR